MAAVPNSNSKEDSVMEQAELEAQLAAVESFVDSLKALAVPAYRVEVKVCALERRGANGYNHDINGISESSDVSLRIERDYGELPLLPKPEPSA